MLVPVKRAFGVAERVVLADQAEHGPRPGRRHPGSDERRLEPGHAGIDRESRLPEHLHQRIDGAELLPANLRIAPDPVAQALQVAVPEHPNTFNQLVLLGVPGGGKSFGELGRRELGLKGVDLLDDVARGGPFGLGGLRRGRQGGQDERDAARGRWNETEHGNLALVCLDRRQEHRERLAESGFT